MKIRFTAALAAVAALSVTHPLQGQQRDSLRIGELERRLEAVTREIERLRLGRDVVSADTSVLGFGPAASKVYKVNQGVSIGGYGEILYENYAAERQDGVPATTRDVVDALRAVVYFGYKFDDRLLFNSEIEVEHADEVGLEFAYLDYKLTPTTGVRAGLLLAPLGLVNELHEPPVFLGTERSVTESRIIPTTWRENGVGLFHEGEDFAWRAYVMNSLDAAGFGASGLRGGRQKGSKAAATDLALVGRLDYVGTPGLLLGSSAFTGNTAQGRELDGRAVAGRVTLWDVHAAYQARGWNARAVVAGAQVGDAADINALNGLSGADALAEGMLGWYVEAGYDVLRGTGSTHQLLPFLRYERVDTQKDVADGFDANPGNDLGIFSLGANWRPVPQVVAKLGYQLHDNAADTGLNQWNVQLGWLF